VLQFFQLGQDLLQPRVILVEMESQLLRFDEHVAARKAPKRGRAVYCRRGPDRMLFVGAGIFQNGADMDAALVSDEADPTTERGRWAACWPNRPRTQRVSQRCFRFDGGSNFF